MLATTAKPPTGLSSSVGVLLPAFKRKRIEQWCDDVGQYLKSGSLCRSVIGHVLEDNRLVPPGPVKSAPAGTGGQRTPHAIANANTTTTTTTAMGTMTEMLSLASKKDGGGGGGLVGVGVGVSGRPEGSAPTPGRGTPMPDTSGPLPVVKFSYSHFNEQRRRTDRLVQGLPVLTASATNSANTNNNLDRLSGGGGGVVVYGEEPPGRGATSKDRQVRTPLGRAASPGPPRPHSRASSADPRQRSSLPAHPSRSHTHTNPTSSSQPNGLQPGKTAGSSEIVVIEEESHSPHQHAGKYAATGFRSVPLNGLRRSQSQKVHKARQRMLAGTRRSGGDHSSHTHVPVQSCWALAELTW